MVACVTVGQCFMLNSPFLIIHLRPTSSFLDVYNCSGLRPFRRLYIPVFLHHTDYNCVNMLRNIQKQATPTLHFFLRQGVQAVETRCLLSEVDILARGNLVVYSRLEWRLEVTPIHHISIYPMSNENYGSNSKVHRLSHPLRQHTNQSCGAKSTANQDSYICNFRSKHIINNGAQICSIETINVKCIYSLTENCPTNPTCSQLKPANIIPSNSKKL